MKTPFRFVIPVALVFALVPLLAGTEVDVSRGFVPCKVHRKAAITYPLTLQNEGVMQGEAAMLLEVDQHGRLRDALVIAYTRKEFAAAVANAVREWEFTPATLHGEPVVSRIHLRFDFEVHGILVNEQRPTMEPFERFSQERFAYRPYNSNELDVPVRAIERPEPYYPKEWMDEGRRGTVTVEFYIDETGATRLVVPIASPDDHLTAVAVDAVKQWRFEPPRRDGRPVLVRTRQSLVFEPPRDRT